MLLINKKEYDFRQTIREIIKEYPKTKEQKNMNKASDINKNKLRIRGNKKSIESVPGEEYYFTMGCGGKVVG